MTRLASASAAVALVAIVWLVLHLFWYPHGQVVDYPVYETYGNLVWHAHEVPYRDFRPEYPPGALPTFVIPAALHDLGYRRVFQALMAACLAGAVLCVLSVAGRRAAALAAVAPLLLGSVVLSRFDLWPAFLAVAAVAAVLRGRLTWSALAFGTGFAAKLWPAVLGPLLLLFIWRRRGRAAALEWLSTSVLVTAVWFLPFVVIAPGGVGHSFYRQLFRPLQVESTGSAILLAIHHLFGLNIFINGGFGSQNLDGRGTGAVGAISSVCELAALAVTYWLFARGETDDRRLIVGCTAAVAALLAFGKVFSPQFLIWLIPLAPLVRSRLARGLFVAALVLTQLYFPRHYWGFVNYLAVRESGIVLVRDLLVVVLYAVLVRSMSASRSRASPVVS